MDEDDAPQTVTRPPRLPAWWGRAISAALIVALVMSVVWVGRQVLLLAFAGVLLALIIDAMVGVVQRVLPLPRWAALAVLLVSVVGLVTLTVYFYADNLVAQVRNVIDQMQQWFQQHRDNILNPVEYFLPDGESDAGSPDADQDDGSNGLLFSTQAMGWITSTAQAVFGALSLMVLISVVAFFLVVNPKLYRDGLVHVLPWRAQRQGDIILTHLQHSLQSWLFGKCLSMIFVTVATLIGLLILGIPSAVVLALLAGALTFIPNFGPIISSVPPIIIAWATQGFGTAMVVALLYIGVQVVEGNLVTPLIQQRVASLAPAVTLFGQIAAGLFLGPLGLVLAVPLVMVIKVLVIDLHVRKQMGIDLEVPLPDGLHTDPRSPLGSSDGTA